MRILSYVPCLPKVTEVLFCSLLIYDLSQSLLFVSKSRDKENSKIAESTVPFTGDSLCGYKRNETLIKKYT